MPIASLLGENADAGNLPATAESASPAMLALDLRLVDEARQLGIDLPAELHSHARRLIAEARQRRWLAENKDALGDANAFVERNGLWSDGKRLF